MSTSSSGFSSSGSVRERTISLPVFVFPEELQFVESERNSHKQVLTIYNPYSFKIRFEGKSSHCFVLSLVKDNFVYSSMAHYVCSCKQHDLVVIFAVFCTAPDHYAVVESSGSIQANQCVDM